MRQREMDLTLDFLAGKKMDSGLEVGAGDGYQTSVMAPKFTSFTSTDLNFDRIRIRLPLVEYIKSDADNFSKMFPCESFDVIFTSSVLEHLSNPDNFLIDSKYYLRKGGYAIHVVPTRFMKVAYMLLFYPNLVVLILEKIINLSKGGKLFNGGAVKSENNLNDIGILRQKSGKFRKLFLPSVHGMYKSHKDEFVEWSRTKWEEMFNRTGYNIVKQIKGEVCSGYGFGMDRIRKILEWLGLYSVIIFILQKNE